MNDADYYAKQAAIYAREAIKVEKVSWFYLFERHDTQGLRRKECLRSAETEYRIACRYHHYAWFFAFASVVGIDLMKKKNTKWKPEYEQ